MRSRSGTNSRSRCAGLSRLRHNNATSGRSQDRNLSGRQLDRRRLHPRGPHRRRTGKAMLSRTGTSAVTRRTNANNPKRITRRRTIKAGVDRQVRNRKVRRPLCRQRPLILRSQQHIARQFAGGLSGDSHAPGWENAGKKSGMQCGALRSLVRRWTVFFAAGGEEDAGKKHNCENGDNEKRRCNHVRFSVQQG